MIAPVWAPEPTTDGAVLGSSLPELTGKRRVAMTRTGLAMRRKMGPASLERRTVLIVEDDPDLRALIVILFEESELEIVECESAEAALATMLMRGRDVVMIFADVRLPGAMDGFDLAREAKMRWPHLTVVLTSGNPGGRIQALPPNVIYMPKPWQASEVLALAERAKSSAQQRALFGR
jgi:DNA-binding NtrC family response regulator